MKRFRQVLVVLLICLGSLGFFGCGGGGGDSSSSSGSSGEDETGTEPVESADINSTDTSFMEGSVAPPDDMGEMKQVYLSTLNATNSRDRTVVNAFEGQVVVQFDTSEVSTTEAEDILSGLAGIGVEEILSKLPAVGLYLIEVEEGTEHSIVSRLGSSHGEDIRYATLNTQLKASIEPFSPQEFDIYSEQLGSANETFAREYLNQINAKGAWGVVESNNILEETNVTSSVIDLGFKQQGFVNDIDENHINQRTGRNISHGFQVATILGAEGNNSKKPLGVNWNTNSRQISVRENSLFEALWWNSQEIGANGVEVVNISLGFERRANENFIRMLADVITELNNQGKQFVVLNAAGNANFSLKVEEELPENLLVVGTVWKDGDTWKKADYSNYGTPVEIYAPSSSGGSFPFFERDGTISKAGGTSFSTPVVAGAASLVWEADPTLSPARVVDVLLEQSIRCNMTGTGMAGGPLDRSVNILDLESAIRAVDDESITFEYSPTFPAVSDTITFDASDSTGDIESFSWDFGDGTSATGESVTHSYSDSGEYTVELTATTSGGDEKTMTRTLCLPGVLARFDYSPKRPEVAAADDSNIDDSQVTFDAAESRGEIDTYSWDFGDGTTGTGESVTHRYQTPGIYPVTLTVTGPAGEDKETKDVIVVQDIPQQIGNQGCPGGDAINVRIDPSTTCVDLNDTGNEMTFEGKVGNPEVVEDLLWDLTGPGGNVKNVVGSFIRNDFSGMSPGLYTATFKPTFQDNGCDKEGNGTGPASTTVNVFKTGIDFSINLGNPPVGNDVTFDASVIDRNLISQNVIIDNYKWDIELPGSQQTVTAQGETVTKTLTEQGTISATLTVEYSSSGGCSKERVKTKSETIVGSFAGFDWTPTNPSPGQEVSFTDQSWGAAGTEIVSWEWSFGDGSTISNEQNPSHTFDEPGVYPVTLTVENDQGARDSSTKRVIVGQFTIQCDVNPQNPEVGEEVQIDVTSSSGNWGAVGYITSFGDGTSLLSKFPPTEHTYSSSGTFTITIDGFASLRGIDASDPGIDRCQTTVQVSERTESTFNIFMSSAFEGPTRGEHSSVITVEVSGGEPGATYIVQEPDAYGTSDGTITGPDTDGKRNKFDLDASGKAKFQVNTPEHTDNLSGTVETLADRDGDGELEVIEDKESSEW